MRTFIAESGLVEPESLQIGAEGLAQIRTLQCVLDAGLEKPELVSAVVTTSLALVSVDRPLGSQRTQAVRQLDLASLVRGGARQMREYVRRQNVAADDRQVGGCFLGRRLLHHVPNAIEPFSDPFAGNHAVARDLVARHAHYRQDRSLFFFEDVQHLLNARDLAVDEIVSQQYREGLFSNQVFGDSYRMSQSLGLLLPHIANVNEIGDGSDPRQLLLLAAVFEKAFELEGNIEMILDGRLTAAGHDDDVLAPGGHRLLHHVLDERLVNQGEHILRLRFGWGGEAR